MTIPSSSKPDKFLTVVMPFLNEGDEPVRTIESILDTSPPGMVEILAIDDGSDEYNPLVSKFPHVRLVRQLNRLGQPESLDKGVKMAQSPNVLMIDAHMTFRDDNWAERLIEILEAERETVFCTTCVHLSEEQRELSKAKQKYYGGTLQMIDPDEADSPFAKQILNPKWIETPPDQAVSDVPCILGAAYAVRKEWYQKLNGLKGLEKWGGHEPFLSLKSFLAGGKVQLIRDIEIGHLFREEPGYMNYNHNLFYNKMLISKTVFPSEISDQLLEVIPQNVTTEYAMNLIHFYLSDLVDYQIFYEKLFTRTIFEYFEKYKLDFPVS